MIFLTLGTQLGFDRLVKAVDDAAQNLDEEVFGQIGVSAYQPKHFAFTDFLTPQDFSARFGSARLIVGHAGMGTILSGMKAEKPLVLMARQAKLGEHRNDHQLATVAQMRRIKGIHIADTSDDVAKLLSTRALDSMSATASPALDRLIAALEQEIFGSARHPSEGV